MSLKKDTSTIKRFLLDRYKNNLAAILIFGSANTGHFVKGKSDIDIIILLKKKDKLNFEKEKEDLFKKTRPFNWSIVHFKTLKEYGEHIYKEASWSSWITVILGSEKIYSTKEFLKFKNELIKRPISKKKLKEYLDDKDDVEIKGYFKRLNGYDLTKSLMSHLRRKLQIITYFKTQKLIFGYEKCLEKNKLTELEKGCLEKLWNFYIKRKRLTKEQVKYYTNLAEELTKTIKKF